MKINGNIVEFNTPQPESLHVADPVVEVPEDVIDPYKWMDEDMDSQLPDEPIIDQYLASLITTIPDVLPSYKDFTAWRYNQPEFAEFNAETLLREEELNQNLIERYNEEVTIPYRKELKEWYTKRKSSFPVLNHIEIDGVLINTDESNIVNEKINSAIRNEIKSRNEQQDKGTEIS
jgi:hypothetical protein